MPLLVSVSRRKRIKCSSQEEAQRRADEANAAAQGPWLVTKIENGYLVEHKTSAPGSGFFTPNKARAESVAADRNKAQRLMDRVAGKDFVGSPPTGLGPKKRWSVSLRQDGYWGLFDDVSGRTVVYVSRDKAEAARDRLNMGGEF